MTDDIKLDEWVFWEQYEELQQSGGGQKQYQKDVADYLATIQKVAWFNDIISFWQIWNTLPVSKLELFFYDKKTENLPV